MKFIGETQNGDRTLKCVYTVSSEKSYFTGKLLSKLLRYLKAYLYKCVKHSFDLLDDVFMYVRT